MIHSVWNWLEPEVLAEIKNKYLEAQGTPSFEINNMGRWGKGLDSGSFAPVIILPMQEYEQYFLEKYKKLDPVFEKFQNVTVFMQIWPPGTQIGWHHDADETVDRIGSTIYLNDKWNWNWGGLFLYDHPELKQGWIFPDHNKMVWFVPPVWHATTMVGLNAEYPRLSLQLFFTADKQ